MEAEVICISSDDESDSQKENKKKSSPANSTELSNNTLRSKVESSSNSSEKLGENHLKRKIATHNNSNIPEKRKKLIENQNIPDTDKTDFNSNDCISVLNKEQKLIVKIPKLVVKERKKVSYVSHDIFPQFISLCLAMSHDNDMKKIVDKLKRRYEKLDSTYTGSESFALFINEKRTAIMNNEKKLYVSIEEVMNELKKIIKEQSTAIQNKGITYDAIPSTSYATNKMSVNNMAKLDDENSNTDQVDSDTRRNIKKVLAAMKQCEHKIKKYESAEVDFNDENDSNYIKETRYKQRMVELYTKLCQLTGENADAGRQYLRPKHISTTQIVSVDQAITNFINSKISKRNQLKKVGAFTNNLIFPDYRDILECVTRCNDKRDLGLDKRKQQQLAKKAFIELGEYLQRARKQDYWDTFSLYFENTELEDPAINDKQLAKKLAHNRIEGDKRLNSVFDKYVKEQEGLDRVTSSGTPTEDESNDDDVSRDEDNDKEKGDDSDCLSLCSLIDKDSDSEGDVEETVQDKEKAQDIVSLTDRNKENTIITNIISVRRTKQNMEKVASNKVKKEMLQVKADENVKLKASEKKADVATFKNKNNNTTTSEEKVCKSPISNAIATPASVTGTVTKTQEIPSTAATNSVTGTITKTQEVPLTAATNNADITDENEENVAEVTIEEIRNVISPTSDSAAWDETTILTRNIAVIEDKIVDIDEILTGALAQAMGDMEDMITEVTEVTEMTATEMTEVTEMTETFTADAPSDKLSDEAKKPLLRVRSFAKPPTTWDDDRHKVGKAAQENVPKITSQSKDIIDLTDEPAVTEPSTSAATATEQPAVTKLQLGSKVLPVVKRHQTVVLPSSSSIISVQNIMNNYLKVDMQTGKIIAPVRTSHKPKIIRVPLTQTATTRQDPLQSTGATATTKEGEHNETVVKITRSPSKLVVKTSGTQVVPKPQMITELVTSKAQAISKLQSIPLVQVTSKMQQAVPKGPVIAKTQDVSEAQTTPMAQTISRPQMAQKAQDIAKLQLIHKTLVIPKAQLILKAQDISKAQMIPKAQIIPKAQVVPKSQLILTSPLNPKPYVHENSSTKSK